MGSESKEEIKFEANTKDGYLVVRLISYLSNRGSVRVEVVCYDGSLRAETLVD